MNAKRSSRLSISRLPLLLLVFLLVSFMHFSRASSQDLLSPTLLAHNAVHTWTTQTGIAVDPRLTLEVSYVIHMFFGTYGSDSASQTQVASLLSDQHRINQVVAFYLNDIISSSNLTIRSLLDRLASEISSRAHHSGWPDIQWNPYRYISFPATSGPRILPAPKSLGGNQLAKSGLILGYGNHLVALEDTHYTLSVLPEGDRLAKVTVPTDDVPADQSASTYQVIPEPSLYCPYSPGTSSHSVRQSRRRSGTRPAEVAPFYQASAVYLRLSDQNSICGSGCQQALAFVVVQAISQWKAGCHRCHGAALRAIRVGNSIWLTSKLLRSLSYELDTGHDSTNTLLEDSNNLQQLGAVIPYGLQFPVGYHKVAGTALAKRLCSANLRRLVGSTTFKWLCENDATSCPSPSCIQFTFALGQRSATCDLGDDARYGCAIPDQSVAINTDHYRFAIPVGTEAPTIVGAGTEVIDIRNLVLHEVGHWFRLPHPSSTESLPTGWGNVMEHQLDLTKKLCITPTSMGQIDEAINDAWKDQLPRSEAFRAPTQIR